MSTGATVQVKSMLCRCLCYHGGTHGGTLFYYLQDIFFPMSLIASFTSSAIALVT